MGDAYVGGYMSGSGGEEFFSVKLREPLIAGQCYDVSFFINRADSGCAINHIGAIFTTEPDLVGSPQIDWSGQFLNDSIEWTEIFGSFIAEGGEEYMTLGNFYPDDETDFNAECDLEYPFGYYYFDDVNVELSSPGGSFSVDLGGPYISCYSQTLTADMDGAYFTWSDGSHGSSLVVTESGTYSVTVSVACVEAEATTEVTILGSPPVTLGPDIEMCEGQAYTITLDPNDGSYLWNDGSTTPEYTFTTTGLYSVTLDDGCDLTSDQIFVNVVSLPLPFTLGEDTTLCPGDTIQYIFDGSIGDFHWQDGSHASSYTISGPGTFALTISNSCGTVSDAIQVDFVDFPDFTLGPDSVILCTGEVINFDFPEDLGDFMWQDGSTESSYQITTAGSYSLTVSNVCGMHSDQIIVTESDYPEFELGDSISLCPGETVTLIAPDFDGEYTWQDGSYQMEYHVLESGIYALTVTNTCGSYSDEIVVDFAPDIQPPDLGADVSLCPGEEILLTVGQTEGSVLWNDLSTDNTLLVLTPGTYAVTVSTECEQYSDTIHVSQGNDGPVLNLTDDFSLCAGETAILDAGIANVSYHWNDGSQGSQMEISSPGIYILTISNACGSDMDSVIVTDGGPPPMVALGADTAICPGDAFVLIPVSSDVQSWLWSDSSSGPTFNVQSSGTIIVNASNQCGQVSDTMEVGLLPDVPTLDLGADISLCPGESQTLTINAPGTDVLWSNGSTDTSFQVNSGGLVYATISNACGSSSDTVQVDILDPIPSLDLGNDQSLCPGETITINPGISGVDYLWQDGSSSPTYEATSPGMIVLTISNDCGSATDSLQIILDPNGPQVDLGPDILACEGDTVVLDAGISGVDYLWNDGSVASQYFATVSGMYSLQVTNACGTDADTILVDMHGAIPTPALGADTTLCDGEALILISDADTETNIEWHASTGSADTGSSFIVTEEGTYILSESNHCGSASDTIVVTFESAPAALDLGEDVVLCPGDSIVLLAPATTDLITWQDGSHGVSIVADQEQVYSLQISNDCGVTSDEVFISFDKYVPVVDLEPSLSICPDQTVTLDVTQAFSATYLWNTGSTLPAIVITQPNDYAVTVSTDCYTKTDAIRIEADDDCGQGIFIPNVFSPNGDNINDEWIVYIDDPDVRGIECRIFDRWGNLVFETNEIPVAWNGRFGERELNPGVYVYVVILTKQDGESDVRSGDITLVR